MIESTLDSLVVVLKSVSLLGFLTALIYSVKCYHKTGRQSHTWLYITLAMGTAVMLVLVRLSKEFWVEYTPQLEIVKVELIPLVIVFLLVAAFTVKRERGFPSITPARESQVSIREASIKVEPSHSYLVIEEKPEESMSMFVNALAEGFEGLCMCRRCPQHIIERFELKKTPCIWLTETSSEEQITISPDLEKILQMIVDFMEKTEKGIIFIGGLDYLIEHNHFERTLSFLERLTDRISMSKSTLILSINRYILNEKERKLIEREVDVVK